MSKRVAYVALPAEEFCVQGQGVGFWGIGICRENEDGYRPVPDYGPYADSSERKTIWEGCDVFNDTLGLLLALKAKGFMVVEDSEQSPSVLRC